MVIVSVWVTIVVAAVLLIHLSTMESSGITLVRGGQSDYTIVIDRRCSPSEQHGAEELQMFLEQICGAKLPIRPVNATPVSGPMILVGSSEVLDRLPVDIDFEALGQEGFVIKTVGPHLVLAGGRLRGSMYACYEFLDKYLGCRWFTAGGPTPPVSRIPRQETIELPHIDYQKIPVLEYREPLYAEAFDGDWAARNRMNSSQASLGQEHGRKIVYKGFVHTFYSLVPPDKYFDEHPEYFSEIDGERTCEGAQLCLTNPEVVKVATESVCQWLREDPEANIVSVSQNDSLGYCQCDKCQALAEREGSQAGPILHFVNQIADNIKDEFPHVAIDTLAYAWSCKPPQYVKPRPNVIVRLCSIDCCFSHPLAMCDLYTNRFFEEDIIGWSKICDRLYVWDYVTDFAHYLLPFPNLHSLQPNIKFFVDHNVKGVFEEGNYNGGGEFAELRSYIMARCLWDPDCDWEKEMNEFLQAYYGPAAGPVHQYIEMLQTKTRKDNIHMDIWTPPTTAYLTEKIINRADELFDKAETMVAHDPVKLLRVKKERLSVDYVKLSRAEEFFPTWQEHEAALENFTQVASDWGNVYVREQRPIEPRLEEWREQVNVRKQRAEGEVGIYPLPDTWKLTIDPDNVGVAEKWFESSFDDRRWPIVHIDQGGGWEHQFPGDTKSSPPVISGYTGFGWYRQKFRVPSELQQRRFVYLYFSAVDEDAYIYLNEEFVYEHSCASTDLRPQIIRTTPFALDAGPYLKYGHINTIAVRVYNRRRTGGVYKPVYLIGADCEMKVERIKALVQQRGK